MAKAHRPNKPHTATMSVDASKDKQSSSLTFPLTAPYRPSITGDEGTGQNKESTDRHATKSQVNDDNAEGKQ